jgi:replicative DNA helicase
MFEEILLKSLIYDGTFFNKIFSLLKTDYFKNIGNKEVFKLLKKYYSEYKERPSEVALVTMVKDVANAELRKELIESLKNVSKTELNSNTDFICDETVKFIKDAIYYKGLELGADGLMNKDETKMKKAQSMFEEMAKVQIDSNLGLDFDDIQTQIDYYSKREYGIKTQHKSINKRLGSGFLPGTLNIILAAQGVGKSLLMCDLISGMLLNSKNVLMVSLEMSENEMLKRIHANVFDIGINTFRDLAKNEGELNQLERPQTTKEDILNAYNKLKMSGTCGKFFVKEYPAGSFSALMLADLVDKFRVEKNIKFDCIFIDYLGIMKSDLISPNAGLYSYVKSIGEEVRGQAVKLGIPIISASQLNRSSINKVEGVDNSAVSDSYGTNATADLMVFILQNEVMKEKSEVLVKFTKNRYTGITDSFMLNIDYQKMRFSDVIDETDFKTFEEKQSAEQFAKQEIRQVQKQDTQIAKKEEKMTTDDILSMIGF